MSDDDRPKKRAKKASHECTVILVDVGANMNKKGATTTDMDLAKDAVEWIITRKVYFKIMEFVDYFSISIAPLYCKPRVFFESVSYHFV